MKNEKFIDYRNVPDETMSFVRKITIHAILENGFSEEEAARFLDISRSAIYEWVKRYSSAGYPGLETGKAPGSEPIMTEEMDRWIKETVLSSTPMEHGFDTTLWTCRIMRTLLHQHFSVDIDESTISLHLKEMGLSYQRPRYRAAEQDPAEVEYFINEKFPRIQKLAEKINADIAFEDESGVGLSDHAGMTWGEVNKTPDVVVPNKRGGYNVLSIVTAKGELRYSIRDQRIDSNAFISFLRQILSGRERPLILLLDRASFHHSKKVRDYVRAHRSLIRVFFLPRYSPEINPDEQVWNEIKNNNLRKQYIKTKKTLKRKLRSALRKTQLNVERVISFFDLDDTRYAKIQSPVIN